MSLRHRFYEALLEAAVYKIFSALPVPVKKVGLPEAVVFRAIFETYRGQFLKKLAFIYVHILAELVKGWVEVSEFHVDEAHEHHRIFWKVVHMSFSYFHVTRLYPAEPFHRKMYAHADYSRGDEVKADNLYHKRPGLISGLAHGCECGDRTDQA